MPRLEMIDDNDFTDDDFGPDPEQFDASEPVDMDECEHCGEMAEDLYLVDSADVTVGYRDTKWLCSKCQSRRKE